MLMMFGGLQGFGLRVLGLYSFPPMSLPGVHCASAPVRGCTGGASVGGPGEESETGSQRDIWGYDSRSKMLHTLFDAMKKLLALSKAGHVACAMSSTASRPCGAVRNNGVSQSAPRARFDPRLGFRVQGPGFRVRGLRFRVWGLGFRVYDPPPVCDVLDAQVPAKRHNSQQPSAFVPKPEPLNPKP